MGASRSVIPKHTTCMMCRLSRASVGMQVPFLSGLESSKQSIRNRGLLQSIRLFLAGLHDRARALMSLPAAYLKVAGLPGSNSFMELAEEDLHQYFAKHPSKYAVRQMHPLLVTPLTAAVKARGR